MAKRLPAVEVSERRTTLVVAVWLVDGYTDEAPVGTFEVSVEGLDIDPIRNPSGYYLFLDVPVDDEEPVTVGDEPVVTVESAEDSYFPFHEKVSLASTPQPLAIVTLTPTPSYSFPGVTMARGIVLDANDTPLEGARVSATGTDQSTWSDARGEFALPLSDLDTETVVTPGSENVPTTVERFVKANGNDPELTVVRPGGDPTDSSDVRTVTEQVPVGTVWFVEIGYS